MTRHKVVILGPEDATIEAERAELADLDVEFVQANPQSEGEAMEVVKDADAIMTRAGWGTAPVMNAAERCQVLATYSHGFDNIDVEACTNNGIILTNSAGMCAEEVSDQAVAFILALNRHVVQATEHVRSGKWDRLVFNTDPLDSQVLGLVGFGNIARLVARKMTGWGMETVVFDPYASPWVIKEYRAEQVFDLNELCSVADYLTVIVPLNDETRHMIGAEQFKAMKKVGVFRERVPGSGGRRESPYRRAERRADSWGRPRRIRKGAYAPRQPALENAERDLRAPHGRHLHAFVGPECPARRGSGGIRSSR